jgi:hypothetical protein
MECDLLEKCCSDDLSNSLRPDLFCPGILRNLYAIIAENNGGKRFELDEKKLQVSREKVKDFSPRFAKKTIETFNEMGDSFSFTILKIK